MTTDRTVLERDHPAIDDRADQWRLAAFVVAALVWIPAAVPATFVGFVGLMGLGSEPGRTPGLVDDLTATGALVAVGVAIVSFAVSFLTLRAVARWSWPDDRRRADVLAAVAAFWLPVLGGAIVAIRGVG